MLAKFCFFLLRITSSTRPTLSFLGMCLIIFAITVLPARGQVLQDAFQPSGYLDSLKYRASLGETNVAFFEFSGSQFIDDPLEDFFAYLIDPINWDSSAPIEHRMAYHTHAEFQTHPRILNGTSLLRFGFETRLEHAHVHSIPSSGGGQTTSEQHQNLVDVVYAPYLFLESQPLSWIRISANLQLNVLTFDVHHACPRTCSLEPKGQGNFTVPSLRGGILLEPWLKTQFFINIGNGFYRFDEREPAGSTSGQQINRTRFVEFGFSNNPGGHIEIRGSLWGTKNDSDFSYNLEDEEFVDQGTSQRYGVNLDTKVGLQNHTTFSGGLTLSRNTFRQSQQPIPHNPQVSGHAELHNVWTANWSTTLRWQYIGKRSADNQSFPSFQTLDILVQYQFPVTADKGHLTASLGIVNVGNHRRPYSLFHLGSGLTPDHSSAIDVNYFPGQPRTILGGISWLF